jgi:hypothetical protein
MFQGVPTKKAIIDMLNMIALLAALLLAVAGAVNSQLSFGDLTESDLRFMSPGVLAPDSPGGLYGCFDVMSMWIKSVDDICCL